MVESGGEVRGSAAWFWAVDAVDLECSVLCLKEEVRALWADTEANRAYMDDLLRGTDEVQRRRLTAVRLLGRTLARVGIDPSFETLSRQPHGKPCLPGRVDVDVSLSHSDTYAACGVLVGSGRIGVDVEEHGRLTEERAGRMLERFFDNVRGDESLPLTQDFVRMWTLREAVCKLDGQGDPLRVDITAIPNEVWRYTRPVDGGFVTVAVECKQNPKIDQQMNFQEEDRMEKHVEKREEYVTAEMDVVELENQDVLTANGSSDIVLPDIPIM